MSSLLQYLEQRAWRGQVIRVAKGPLARTLPEARVRQRRLDRGEGAVAWCVSIKYRVSAR